MIKIRSNKDSGNTLCEGTNIVIENNLTDVKLLKYKGKTQMMKVRFTDDGGNTYDAWMSMNVVDQLGDML